MGDTEAVRYPPIEPYADGLLDVGDGHHIYWEVSGNPAGKPVVVVHGGPGSGSRPGPRRSFGPDRYRIVQFDQRGCGRSTPHASEVGADLSLNTTAHLVADMELLRQHLAVERWLVFGGSWGSTLALVYAEQFPERVSELILIGVTLARYEDLDWLYHGVRRFFPEAWDDFRRLAPGADTAHALMRAYSAAMEQQATRLAAAQAWCAWEDAVLSTEDYGKAAPYSDRDQRELLAFVRICSHFFRHRCWLDDGQILRDAGRLAEIPGVLLHGRRDLSSPLSGPWDLSKAWPRGRLTVFDAAGHKGDLAMAEALLAATREFARN